MLNLNNHNTAPQNVETIAADELRQFVERIERLTEEKQAIQGDIKDVFGEAKGRGYDSQAIRACIKARKEDAQERSIKWETFKTYMSALGSPVDD